MASPSPDTSPTSKDPRKRPIRLSSRRSTFTGHDFHEQTPIDRPAKTQGETAA